MCVPKLMEQQDLDLALAISLSQQTLSSSPPLKSPQLDEDDFDDQLDYAIALSLQGGNEEEAANKTKTLKTSLKKPGAADSAAAKMSLIDPQWEMIDPTPNIHQLFIEFNKTYFWGRLDMVEVKWSPQMTL